MKMASHFGKEGAPIHSAKGGQPHSSRGTPGRKDWDPGTLDFGTLGLGTSTLGTPTSTVSPTGKVHSHGGTPKAGLSMEHPIVKWMRATPISGNLQLVSLFCFFCLWGGCLFSETFTGFYIESDGLDLIKLW